MSVCAQVASPLSKGLFRAAIAESGSLMGGQTPAPLQKTEQIAINFMQKNNIASVTDLRNMPAEQLLQLSAGTRFSVTIDGYVLPETPQAIFDQGKQMHVPLLAGWNSAEGDVHGYLEKNAAITTASYQKAVQRDYGTRAAEVLNTYAAPTDADVTQAATDLATDRFMGYPTWKFTDQQLKTGGAPVYRYLFLRRRPGNSNPYGAVHASEIEFALGNLPYNKVYAWTTDDYQVSETMQTFFANFIKTGNPNGAGLPTWNKAPEVMHIDLKSETLPDQNAKRYQLLDTFYKP
jgi:para-nitrobenzyl esterase